MSKFFEHSPGNYEVITDVHAECKERLSSLAARLGEETKRAEILREGLQSLGQAKDAEGWAYCAVCSNWMDERCPAWGHADHCLLVPLLAAALAPGAGGGDGS